MARLVLAAVIVVAMFGPVTIRVAQAQGGVNLTINGVTSFYSIGSTFTIDLPGTSCCIPTQTWGNGSFTSDVAFNASYVSSTGAPAPNSGTGGLQAWCADSADSYNGCTTGEALSFTWPVSVAGWESVGIWSDTVDASVTYQIDSIYSTPTSTPSPTVTPTPIPPGPPGTCNTSYDITYDFTDADPHGWTGNPGGPDNDGFTAGYTDIPGGGGSAVYLILQHELGSGSLLTNIDLDIEYQPGSSGSDTDLRKIQAAVGATTLDLGAGSPPAAGRHTYSWSGSQSAGLLVFNLFASGITAIPNGYLTVKSVRLRGNGFSPDGVCNALSSTGDNEDDAWAFPVAPADMIAGGPISELTSDNGAFNVRPVFKQFTDGLPGDGFDTSKVAIQIYSIRQDAYIHSATDGTVSSVVALTGDPCLETSLIGPLINAPAYTCQHTDYQARTLRISYQSVSLVTIQLSAGKLTYAVRNANVQEGQTVSKGCVLGYALSYYTLNIGVQPNIGVSVHPSTEGYTVIQGRDETETPFDILPYLKLVPENRFCGQQANGGCDNVHNPTFQSPNAEWSPSSGAVQNPTGENAGLLLVGSVRQSILLSSSTEYTITVKSHLLQAVNDVAVTFEVQLGSSAPTTIHVSGLSSQTTVIPASTYEPTIAPDMYDLVLRETPNTRSNVVVDFICISDGDEQPPLPSDCILQNFEFNDSSIWDMSGGAIISGGLAHLPDSASISQDVMLSPAAGGDQDYTLSVDARRAGAPADGESISLDYDLVSSGTFSGSFSTPTIKTLTATITVSTKDTYTLTLTADGSSQTLEIDKVCIKTSDGSPPPGYKQPPPIPFTALCKVCSYSPIGDVNYDLPEVIGWLFCALSQIWNCQAKTILYGIWQALITILTFLGFMRLWFSYTMTAGATWLNSDIVIVARYFNAQFINLGQQLYDAIAYGPRTSTTVVEAGTNFGDVLISAFNTIRDVIGNLQVLASTLIDRLFSVAMALISLVSSVITLLGLLILTFINNVLGLFPALIGSLINGINVGAATLPPGAPTCSDPDSAAYGICLGFYVLDNTVWSGWAGQLLPLLLGAASFKLILWGFLELKRAFTSD